MQPVQGWNRACARSRLSAPSTGAPVRGPISRALPSGPTPPTVLWRYWRCKHPGPRGFKQKSRRPDRADFRTKRIKPLSNGRKSPKKVISGRIMNDRFGEVPPIPERRTLAPIGGIIGGHSITNEIPDVHVGVRDDRTSPCIKQRVVA